MFRPTGRFLLRLMIFAIPHTYIRTYDLPTSTPPSCHHNSMSRRQYDDGIRRITDKLTLTCSSSDFRHILRRKFVVCISKFRWIKFALFYVGRFRTFVFRTSHFIQLLRRTIDNYSKLVEPVCANSVCAIRTYVCANIRHFLLLKWLPGCESFLELVSFWNIHSYFELTLFPQVCFHTTIHPSHVPFNVD